MISQHLRSILRCLNLDQSQSSQKLLTARNPKRLYTRKWLVKILLILLTILSIYLYIYSFNNIAAKKDTESMKYILTWTPNDWFPFSTWRTGQQVFVEKGCRYSNCFVTNRRDFFGDDLTKFDAIAFNARNLNITTVDTFERPLVRSYHQKYIFINTESSDNIPICSSVYDGFFNWTATYKLNSDIVYSYIAIKDFNGREVGPKANMTWNYRMKEDNTELKSFNKTKAVAWLVSNCFTRNKREMYAKNLKRALGGHKLALDIYGRCGSRCKKCSKRLRKYYFYLSFENSLAEDYVTEKLVTALRNGNVPIVFGGADYSRFLPPGSYLDARKHSPQELAAIIARVIDSPAEYNDFFRWRSHYTYQEPDNACRLCAALNDVSMRHSVYEDLRAWWNPDYKKRCQEFYHS